MTSSSSSSSSSAHPSTQGSSKPPPSSSSLPFSPRERFPSDFNSTQATTPATPQPPISLTHSFSNLNSTTQSFQSPSNLTTLADGNSNPTNPIRPKTLNRIQSKGLSLNIPSDGNAFGGLNNNTSEQDRIQDLNAQPSTPSLSNHPPNNLNLLSIQSSTNPLDASPKRPRKRPAMLALKPIATGSGLEGSLSNSNEVSKSVPNSPSMMLSEGNVAGGKGIGSGVGIGTSNLSRNSHYQESKDLRDTLRGTPRRRPSMPFGNKGVPPSIDPTTPSTSNTVSTTSESSTPGLNSASLPSALRNRPEAFRDPSEHILSGRGSTLQHARSVYAAGPVEILPGVWLGDEHNARDSEVLSDLNITTILNVAKETTLPFQAEGASSGMKVRRRNDGTGSTYLGMSRHNSREGKPSNSGVKSIGVGGIPNSSSSRTITASTSNSNRKVEDDVNVFSPSEDDFFTPPTTANPFSANSHAFGPPSNSPYQSFSSTANPPTPSRGYSTPADLINGNTVEFSILELEQDPDSPPHYLRNTSSTPNLQTAYHTPSSSNPDLHTPRENSNSTSSTMARAQESSLTQSMLRENNGDGSSPEESALNRNRRNSDSTDFSSTETFDTIETETSATSTTRSSLNESRGSSPSASHKDLKAFENPILDTNESQTLIFPRLASLSDSLNRTPIAEVGKGAGYRSLKGDSISGIKSQTPSNSMEQFESKVVLPSNAIALTVPPSPLQGRVSTIRYIKLPWTHDEVSLASSNGGGFQLGCEIISEAIGLVDGSDLQDEGEDGEEEVPPTPSASTSRQRREQLTVDGAAVSSLRTNPSKGSILVHCQCGVSRSATLVIAFVMQAAALGYGFKTTEDLTGMHDCYSFVKDKSSSISPNCSLIYQLVEWERHLSAEANRLRALLGVQDSSHQDSSSSNDSSNTNSQLGAGAPKPGWAGEAMDEEEWTRMRREEEMKDAEEQEREKKERLEEAKRQMAGKKKKEEELLASEGLGGVGAGLGARRKKKIPSLLLGSQSSSSQSANSGGSGSKLGSAALKSARPKLGLSAASLAKPLKNLTLESASESEETEPEASELEISRRKDEEESKRTTAANRDQARAQLEFGSPSKPKTLTTRARNLSQQVRPVSTSSVLFSTPGRGEGVGERNSSSGVSGTLSGPSTSHSLSSIPSPSATTSVGIATSSSTSSVISTPNSRRSSVQMSPSSSFGAKRLSAQERRNQHRRTFSSDWPTIQKGTLQSLGILASNSSSSSSSQSNAAAPVE